jgi:hypothetical protein
MAQTIQLKRSSTSGATPSAGSLSAGELAVNTADGKVFLKKANGNVVGLTDGLQTSLANITHANSTLISGTNWVRGDVQVYTSGSYTKKQYNGFYSTTNGAEPASFQVGLACLTTSTNALHDEHFLEVSESGVFLGSSDLAVNSLSQLYAQRDNIQVTFAPGDTHSNQRTQLSMISGSIGDLTGNSTSTSLTSQNSDDQVGIQLANNGTHALATLLMPTTLTLLYGANSILTRGYADSRYLASTQTITNTFNNRTGNVSLTSNDVTTALTFAPLTSSTPHSNLSFTGTSTSSPFNFKVQNANGSKLISMLSVTAGTSDIYLSTTNTRANGQTDTYYPFIRLYTDPVYPDINEGKLLLQYNYTANASTGPYYNTSIQISKTKAEFFAQTYTFTDYSLLTRVYADTRYAAIGSSSGGIFDGGSASTSDNTFDGGSATG